MNENRNLILQVLTQDLTKEADANLNNSLDNKTTSNKKNLEFSSPPIDLTDRINAKTSLFIFDETNRLRKFCINIATTTTFIKIINFIIIANCLFLVFETIDNLRMINDYSNIVFNTLFAIEMIIKIIAYGFVLEKSTYLRDPWNILDFIIVIGGIVSYFFENQSRFLVLRTFRLIRPLKTLSMLPNMRIFISTLLSSFLDLSNVFFLVLFFIFIFGVIGLSFWVDSLNYKCRTTLVPVNGTLLSAPEYNNYICGGVQTCGGNTNSCLSLKKFYDNGSYFIDPNYKIDEETNLKSLNYGLTNFKNFINSIFVVFFTTTGEGWSDIMYIFMNGNNYYVSYIYFVLCVIINKFFIINLIVAVLLYNFSKNRSWDERRLKLEKNKYQIKNGPDKNNKLVENFNFLLNEETEKKKYRRKYMLIKETDASKVAEGQNFDSIIHRLRKTRCFEQVKRNNPYHNKFYFGYLCYLIYKQPIVQNFFYLCIIFNSIILTFNRVDQPESEFSLFEKLNIYMVSIFSLEMFLLLMGLGCIKFFRNIGNIWDLLIVSLSLIEISILNNFTNRKNSSTSAASIFRMLRIFRILKLIRSWQSFQVILASIKETIIRMADFFVLLFVYLFMFTLLGYNFFNNSLRFDPITDKYSPDAVPNYYNFDDFLSSLISVFQLLIGDNWHKFFYDCYRSEKNNQIEAILFFTIFAIFGHITMLNIFLSYLIDNFEKARSHLYKNIRVKSFIENVIYYCSKQHELEIIDYQSKNIKNSNVVSVFNFYLQKLENKKLLSEGRFLISAKSELDFNLFKKKNLEFYNKKLIKEKRDRYERVIHLEDYFLNIEKSNKNGFMNLNDLDKLEFYEFEINYEKKLDANQKLIQHLFPADKKELNDFYSAIKLKTNKQNGKNKNVQENIEENEKENDSSENEDDLDIHIKKSPSHKSSYNKYLVKNLDLAPMDKIENLNKTTVKNFTLNDKFLRNLGLDDSKNSDRNLLNKNKNEAQLEVQDEIQNIIENNLSNEQADNEPQIKSESNNLSNLKSIYYRGTNNNTHNLNKLKPNFTININNLNKEKYLEMSIIEGVKLKLQKTNGILHELSKKKLENMSSNGPEINLERLLAMNDISKDNKYDRFKRGHTKNSFSTFLDTNPNTTYIPEKKKFQISNLKRKNSNMGSQKDDAENRSKNSRKISKCCSPLYNHFINSSLGIFHKDFKFRIFVKKIVENIIFDYIITFFIIFNCIILCLDTPWNDPESTLYSFILYSNYILTCIFLIEAFMKIIAYGFFYRAKEKFLTNTIKTNSFLTYAELFLKDKFNTVEFKNMEDEEKVFYIKKSIKKIQNQTAYIMNLSNLIDFVVTIIGCIDIFGFKSVRYLRTFRALRSIKPIRIITKNENLKLIVKCIIGSIPAMANVLLVCAIFLFIYALLGINLFKSDMNYYCTLYQYSTYDDCILNEGKWIYNPKNFSNFLFSLKTLFEITLAQGWAEIMKISAQNTQSKWTYIYFVSYVIIGFLFMLNLFVSIVVSRFKSIKSTNFEFSKLSEDEKDWIKVQKIMLRFRPLPILDENNKSRFKKLLHEFIISSKFDKVIVVIILLSMLSLVAQYDGAHQNYNFMLDLINYIFILLFNIEIALKIYIYRRIFFLVGGNLFDLIVLFLCDVMVILNCLEYLGIIYVKQLSSLPIILRTFRFLRVIRLLTVYSKLRALIDTLLYLLPTIFNIGTIMFILYIIYGCIGMNLFATIPYRQQVIHENNNFRDFVSSALVLFRATTGENWNYIMDEVSYHECKNMSSADFLTDKYCIGLNNTCIDEDFLNFTSLMSGSFSCGNNLSYLYFISFMIIGPIFIINLCIVTVIEGYSESIYENENLLSQEYIDKFLEVWMIYDPKLTKLVRPHEFILILKQLPPPLGFNYDRSNIYESRKMLRDRNKMISYRKLIEEDMKINKVDTKFHFDDLKDDVINSDNTYEIKSFYLSRDKKFFTTDLEVLKICDQFKLTAYEKVIDKKNTFSYTFSKKNFTDSKQFSRIENINENETALCLHFVEACLALSKLVISKKNNISREKLREKTVGKLTINMWKGKYTNENIDAYFEDSKNKNTISQKLSIKMMLKVKHLFTRKLKYVRERIAARNAPKEEIITKEKEEEEEEEEEEEIIVDNEQKPQNNNLWDSFVIQSNTQLSIRSKPRTNNKMESSLILPAFRIPSQFILSESGEDKDRLFSQNLKLLKNDAESFYNPEEFPEVYDFMQNDSELSYLENDINNIFKNL